MLYASYEYTVTKYSISIQVLFYFILSHLHSNLHGSISYTHCAPTKSLSVLPDLPHTYRNII